MPVYLLDKELIFPPPEDANEEGIVAVGGDLSPERLLLAYRQGIFPWPARGYPLLWFSPDPRFALVPSDAHVSTSWNGGPPSISPARYAKSSAEASYA